MPGVVRPLLVGALYIIFGDALVLQRNASVDSDVADHVSFCNLLVIQNSMKIFQQQFNGQPRVALFVAERLRFPARKNERIDRWARALSGADVFVAVPPEDAEKIQFLPKATRVGVFNHTYDAAFPEGDSWQQFRRVSDAFTLLQKQEQQQGWKYDVVARIRTEIVQQDMCNKGPDQGCYAKGAWQRAIAAQALSPQGKEAIYMAHDRAFWGRRDVMQKLVDSLGRSFEETVHDKFMYREVGLCGRYIRYDVHVASGFGPTKAHDWQGRLKHAVGEWELYNALEQLNLTSYHFDNEVTGGPAGPRISDGVKIRVSVKGGDLRFLGIGAGVDIRSFGCDYSASEGVTDRLLPYDPKYHSGCSHFPIVHDATEHLCPKKATP